MGIGNALLRLAGASCPNCKKALQTQDFNQETQQMKCSQCQTIIERPQVQSMRIQKIDKTQIVPSKAVRMSNQSGVATITKRWFTSSSLSFVLFSLVWVSMVAFFTLNAFSLGFSLPLVLFMSMFWLAGSFLVFRSLQNIFNTTIIQFHATRVIVRDHPITFSKPKTYEIAKIANFSVSKNTTRDSDGDRTTHYGVYVHLTNGDHEKVCGAKNMAEAIYIEHLLEKQLGIEDNTQYDRVEA